MAAKAIERQLSKLREMWRGTPYTDWPFKDMLTEITSIANTTPAATPYWPSCAPATRWCG
jgi:hypothetical protein